MTKQEEIWLPIALYEGLYSISNLGRIKNKENKILKGRKDQFGYVKIHLYKNNTRKSYRVHRLVAETFLKAPVNSSALVVNHLNADTSDNRVSNLEWATYRENLKYAQRVGNRSNLTTKKKTVAQFTKDGELIGCFCSVRLAAKTLCIAETSIRYAASGRTKSSNGFVFQYTEK